LVGTVHTNGWGKGGKRSVSGGGAAKKSPLEMGALQGVFQFRRVGRNPMSLKVESKRGKI